MSDRRLLRVILDETVRSPNRQAEARETRRLYGDGFDAALSSLRAHGFIADRSLDGHIALTPAGLAAAREVRTSSFAE